MKSENHLLSLVTGRLFYVLLVLFQSVGMNMATAGDKSEPKTKAQGPKVAFQTVYLQEPIGRAHRIFVKGELGGSGHVTLEGNTCTITQFGDTGVCTEIAFQPIEIKIRQLRLADPAGQGRRLFQLDGKLDPADANFYLVVPRRRSQPHRLVVDLKNDRRRVVTLEPWNTSRCDKPTLCKTAQYRAQQAEGKVTLYAQGTHPTAGWKAAFEPLPQRIFPPQFRLVCVAPKGLVAQVITPFQTETSFVADQPIDQVVVHDETGKHSVSVEKLTPDE